MHGPLGRLLFSRLKEILLEHGKKDQGVRLDRESHTVESTFKGTIAIRFHLTAASRATNRWEDHKSSYNEAEQPGSVRRSVPQLGTWQKTTRILFVTLDIELT
jgi:hypothetical protein